MFNDDLSHYKIMKESNPYKMKKLGSRIRNFSHETWRKSSRKTAYKAAKVKFSQNPTLQNILLETGDKFLAENSLDTFWGTGLHLHNRIALDRRQRKNKDGGAMSNILAQVRQELRN